MISRPTLRNIAVAAVSALVVATACAPEDDSDVPDLAIEEDRGAPDDEQEGDCEVDYQLPDGTSYALEVDSIEQPETIADAVQAYIGSIPPVLLFVQGLTDGSGDSLELVGGLGERTSYGEDEIAGTDQDVYSMYYGSISPDTCDYQARLEGQSVFRELEASGDRMDIDLGGFSSLTEGLSLQVREVELDGQFNKELDRVVDIVLAGVVRDEGLDDLLDAVEERLPISREQAEELIEPDEDGNIDVELTLEGRLVEVRGFTDAEEDEELEPRADAGSCCPDGLEVGDSIIDYLEWGQQGLDTRQYELFQMALPSFRDDDKVAMVATARQRDDGTVQYEVYSGGARDEGFIIFERTAGDETAAPDFEIVEQAGTNPLANTDPTALSEYEEFLEVGTNPEDTTYEDRFYFAGDPRLAFVPPEQMHYPYAFERIAQNFDDPRAGDLMVLPASWATGGFSTHGNLGALQSRAPMLIAGPGVKNADSEVEGEAFHVDELGDGNETLFVEDAVRQVDIAPTVAAALGVDQTTGVGPQMRLDDEVYLSWQDGRVLEEIFTDEAIADIEAGQPVAERAVIIINDGLTNTELLFQALTDEDDFDVDAYQDILDSGMAYRYGAIANFPSNTFPGHNTVGSGAWAGHHGVLDNRFWVREQGLGAAPISDLFETEHLFGSAHANLPVETLYEAVTRTYGDLEDGVFTASINEPSTRGADYASTEYREPEGFEPAEDSEIIEIGGESYQLPPAEIDHYSEVMDNTSTSLFAELYQDHLNREDGLPIPKFSFVNMASTDTAGHAHGPHGDYERYEVISRTNDRMNRILQVLEELEIDEETMVVLTADHGMELQDRSRSSSRSSALRDAGVEFRSEGWYHYFKQLAVQVEDVQADGDRVTYSLRVIDRATRQADEPGGVPEVDIEVVDGANFASARTDEDGYADISVTPHGDDGVLFEFDSSQWNMHRERLDH